MNWKEMTGGKRRKRERKYRRIPNW